MSKPKKVTVTADDVGEVPDEVLAGGKPAQEPAPPETPKISAEEQAVADCHAHVENARVRVRACRVVTHPDFEPRLGDFLSAGVQLGRAMEVLAKKGDA